MTTLTRAQEAQHLFFQQIRDKLAPHLSLVDEVEELLSISQDSAYRRIRAEKELSFGEMQVLCAHFGVSADMVFNINAGQVVSFRYNALNPDTFNLKDYITSAYNTIKTFSDKPDCEMLYAAKDIPIFHYFQMDELASFKFFVWQKTLLGFPEYENAKFAIADTDPEFLKTGRKLLEHYQHFPSSELWNEETINSILRQLEYYCESDLFKDKSEALLIADKLEEYVEHLRLQAQEGLKLIYGREKQGKPFKLYHNEVVLSDNTIVARFGDKKVTFLTHNAINFLTTNNTTFCDNTMSWMTNLIRKSSLISSTSEKQRNQFFGVLLAKVKKTKERVKYLISE